MSAESTYKLEPFDITADTAVVLLRVPIDYEVDDGTYRWIEGEVRAAAGRAVRVIITPEGYGLENATEDVMYAAGWVRRSKAE